MKLKNKEDQTMKPINIETSRESGSSVNNNTKTLNTKTLNTKHLTLNTTSAPEGTSKELDGVSSTPSVRSIRDAVPHLDNQKLADLEAEVVSKRKARETREALKHKEFKDDKAQLRKKMQAGKEASASSIVKSDYLHRIEVSMHRKSKTDSIKLYIDVLQEAGGYFQKFKAVCQNRRARDIMQGIPPKFANWPGYEHAKCAIRDGDNAGKICLRQSGQNKTKIATKTIPQAVAIFNRDTNSVEILFGDKSYTIDLLDTPHLEYFMGKGILQNQQEEEWMDLD